MRGRREVLHALGLSVVAGATHESALGQALKRADQLRLHPDANVDGDPKNTLNSTAGAAPVPREMDFPRDHGAHLDYRTEWWYITGEAIKTSGKAATNASDEATIDPAVLAVQEPDYGFQLTFFRTRVDATQGMQSRFAAKQLIFAHAAVTDVKGKKLWHDQRIARSSGATSVDLASAGKKTTTLELRDWSLKRTPVVSRTQPDAVPGSLLTALLPGRDAGMQLLLRNTQPLLLQGAQGLSRKGPEPSQSSWYYSQPHLSVEGSLTLSGRQVPILGRAWFDHEWSESVMHPQAVGWDWIGINFDNGSALTAFRVRDKTGRAMWDGGSFRTADQALRGEVSPFQHEEVAFRPLRQWKSPTSGATYPVEWLVRTPQDVYTVRALVDDQELDSSSSTGTIYWEGISELLDNRGQRVGRGYLEMTGYVKPLRL